MPMTNGKDNGSRNSHDHGRADNRTQHRGDKWSCAVIRPIQLVEKFPTQWWSPSDPTVDSKYSFASLSVVCTAGSPSAGIHTSLSDCASGPFFQTEDSRTPDACLTINVTKSKSLRWHTESTVSPLSSGGLQIAPSIFSRAMCYFLDDLSNQEVRYWGGSGPFQHAGNTDPTATQGSSGLLANTSNLFSSFRKWCSVRPESAV